MLIDTYFGRIVLGLKYPVNPKSRKSLIPAQLAPGLLGRVAVVRRALEQIQVYTRSERAGGGERAQSKRRHSARELGQRPGPALPPRRQAGVAEHQVPPHQEELQAVLRQEEPLTVSCVRVSLPPSVQAPCCLAS